MGVTAEVPGGAAEKGGPQPKPRPRPVSLDNHRSLGTDEALSVSQFLSSLPCNPGHS